MCKDKKNEYINRKKRNKFGLPIVISLDNDNIKLPARLNDINEDGLSFKSNVCFNVADVFDILIPFPKGILFFDQENLKPLKITVELRWIKDYNLSDDFLVKYLIGVKIIKSNDADYNNKINKLIKLSIELGQKPLGF